MKKYFIFFVFIFSFQPVSLAQDTYSNAIIFSDAYCFFPKTYVPEMQFQFLIPGYCWNFGDEFSVAYERKVYKNWGIGINYTTWDFIPILNMTGYRGNPGLGGGGPNATNIGGLEGRQRVKMADLYATYRYDHLKRHKFTTGLGVSYTWGQYTYIDTIYYNGPPIYDAIIVPRYQKGDNWGILVPFRYDYLFLKQHLSMGIDFKYRKYFGLYSSEFDYGFHLSFNF